MMDSVIEDRFRSDNIFILRPEVPDSPESRDPRKVRAPWLEYLAWTKTAQGRTSPRDHAVSLDAKGAPSPEIRRRPQVIRSQSTGQPEGIEMIYDPLYGKPLTGAPEKVGDGCSRIMRQKDLQPLRPSNARPDGHIHGRRPPAARRISREK